MGNLFQAQPVLNTAVPATLVAPGGFREQQSAVPPGPGAAELGKDGRGGEGPDDGLAGAFFWEVFCGEILGNGV